jgi:nitrate/nitrite transporter NarK
VKEPSIASPATAATGPATVTRKAWSVLAVSTLSFTVCFMVWMMFGVIGIPIRKTLNLNATEFGLLTAMPVLTGSLVRVPLGIWTDRYGGRIVMAVLMAVTVPAIWTMSYATAYWHFLVIGLFVGLAGGMGGFVLPIMFGALMDLTGIRSSAFMLMYGVVWVSLIWMYFTEVRRTEVMGSQATEGPSFPHLHLQKA